MSRENEPLTILDSTHDAYVITTSLPYVNSIPHVGFGWEATIADTTARYLRSLGKEVLFLSGSDDNSSKISYKAAEVGDPIEDFVNRHALKFEELQEGLGLSYDLFYRTYSQFHFDFVNDFVDRIDDKFITKQEFSSYFCADCESFVGKEPESPDCGFHAKPYELIEENDYFFKVDELRDSLHANIRNKNILPPYAADQSAKICEEFQDFNFTRENKYGWGVVYKKDPDHIFYSFPEALIGYLGGIAMAGVTLDEDVRMIQNIGRDILKFHSVYFPYLLLAAGGDKTPDDLIVHGFVNIEGQKMSKSRNNIVSMDTLLDQFDKNIIRLYLLSKDMFSDFDFQAAELHKMSEVFTAYRNNFAPAIQKYVATAESSLFHENMVGWRYEQNLAHFMQIVTTSGGFNSLSSSDKDFLVNFSKVFIV